MKRLLRFAPLLLASFLAAQPLPAQVPRIEGPVTDQAGVLSPSGITAIEAEIAEHRRKTGVQIAVLTVETTGVLPIEEFSLKVAEAWAGGSRGRDDGILFTLAVRDRKMRTEVGYGLEPHLPDAKVLQIQEGVRDALRSGDFDGAIREAVEQLAAATGFAEEGMPIPHPPVPLGARMPWTYLGVFYLGAAGAVITLSQEKGSAKTRDWRIWNWTFGLGIPGMLALLFLGGRGFWWAYPLLFATSAGLIFLVSAIWDDSKVCGAAAGLWYYAIVPAAFLLRGQLGGSGIRSDRWDGEELLITAVAHLFGCVTLSLLFPFPYLMVIWNRQQKSGKASGLGALAFSGGRSGSTCSWSSGRSGGSSSGASRSWSGGGGRFGGGGATSSW